jgi:hypothetical protein
VPTDVKRERAAGHSELVYSGAAANAPARLKGPFGRLRSVVTWVISGVSGAPAGGDAVPAREEAGDLLERTENRDPQTVGAH